MMTRGGSESLLSPGGRGWVRGCERSEPRRLWRHSTLTPTLSQAWKRGIEWRCFLLLLAILPWAFATPWSEASDGVFTVRTASVEDARALPQVYDILQQARLELRRDWGLAVPEAVTVVVHPDLVSYQEATGMPWYVAALADREAQQIHTQRLRVLLERRSLETTLRHELFHLAQPEDWPRWRAEGSAMLFAGETPQAPPLPGLSDEALDALLAAPPSREWLLRAMATAYQRVRTQGAP